MKSVFSAYGIVVELLQPTENTMTFLLLNSIALLFCGLLIITASSAGSSLTRKADDTKIVVATMINEEEIDDSKKIDFIFFNTQVQSRNMSVQNDLFKINWNISYWL